MSSSTDDSATRPRLRIGVVGLGMIGGGVAVSLVRSGAAVVTHDLRSDAADALAGVPAPLASAADVARASEIVLVAVVDAGQARAALAGSDGVLAGASKDLVVVLLCTISPDAVRELAALCGQAGVALVDCGVTPGFAAAEGGTVAMVGGDDDHVERAMPVLERFAKSVVHCGPLGSGMATKIACNVVTYATWRAVHEATALVAGAGVDVSKLAAVLRQANPAPLLWQDLRHTPLGERAAPKLRALMDKDLAAAQELAVAVGVAVPLVDVARAMVRDTVTAKERSVS